MRWYEVAFPSPPYAKHKWKLFLGPGAGEVAALQQQIKSAEAAEKSVRQGSFPPHHHWAWPSHGHHFSELADEERELKRLSHVIKKLREKENLCPQDLAKRQQQLEKQKQRLDESNKSLVTRQREVTQSLQALVQDVERYRDRLGLDLQRVAINHMRFVFVHIDPDHPTRQFSFDLFLDPEDRYQGSRALPRLTRNEASRVHMLTHQHSPTVAGCKPPVEGLAQMEAALNGEAGDLGKFVVAIRKKFRESVVGRNSQ